MKKLENGEQSAVYRVRGSAELHQWLASMTAEERGQLLQSIMPTGVTPADTERLAINAAADDKQASSAPAGTGVTPVARAGQLLPAERLALWHIENGAELRQIAPSVWSLTLNGQPITSVKGRTLAGLVSRGLITPTS